MLAKGKNKTSRLLRRARVTQYEQLTSTGTIRLSFEVIDEHPFDFEPGQFVAIDCDHATLGYRRSPYCIFSPPNAERSFQLLVRTIPEGPVSLFLSRLEPGDVISFRGATGVSMIPREPHTELILLATGVGLGPFNSLIRYLAPNGFKRPLRLFWGLRLPEDICLTEELNELAAAYPNFQYQISLSQPPANWPGLRGRVTESAPPLLETLGNKHFYFCGNGAMIAEMSRVLSDLGVPQTLICEEYYFNFHHQPDEPALHAIRRRFTARDLFSPFEQIEIFLSNQNHSNS